MLKRTFDLLASLMALAVLWPLMLLIAVCILWDSPGPVLFRQERVGLHGRRFLIRKFRTMVVQAPALGPELTVGDDHRITSVGRWLRDRRLDELPQLLDVLQGHMSLVGPRPEVPRYVALYPADLRERILAVRPGLTDPAALAHLDEARRLAQAPDPEAAYVQDILPRKLSLQANYAARAGFWSDMRILWRTLSVLFKR